MNWEQFLGHQQQYGWFQNALTNGRLASSFLFVGPIGVGKATFAKLLAQSLLCRSTRPDVLEHCGGCEDCAQVEAGTHPDLIQVAKPADRAFLPIELLIGEREKRMREGLCHDISLRPYAGLRKVAILNDVDYLNVEGANCLLKTLEEPPADSVLILIGTSLQRQLPTIRSRCQSILFQGLDAKDLAVLIQREGLSEDPEQARLIAAQSRGSLSEAHRIADPEVREFRSQLFTVLSRRPLPMQELAKNCGAIVDAAGKETRLKRDRMQLLLRMASQFYRELSMRLQASESVHQSDAQQRAGAADPQSAITLPGDFVASWRGGVSGALKCWNRCLDAMAQVERNANQASLLEAWASDIARYSLA